MKKNINRIKVVLVDKGKTSAQEKKFPVETTGISVVKKNVSLKNGSLGSIIPQSSTSVTSWLITSASRSSVW